MNIAIVGVGGVGGYFGGLISQLLKSDESLKVFFIARNEHLSKIKENGLLLESVAGSFNCVPTLATDDPELLPVLDVILLCVKGYDLENAIISLQSKITDKTIILPLLNGIDIYERVKKIVPHAVVLPACVFIGAHIEKPGHVIQDGGSCTIIFGSDPINDTSPAVLTEIFDRSNIKYLFTPEATAEIWKKYIFIAPFSLVCAYYDKTMGEVLDDTQAKVYLESIIKEIYSLATAIGISLPESIIADSIEKGRGFSYKTKTSFHRDYEDIKKKDEREIFGKAIIDLGKKLNIETPITSVIYEALNTRKVI